MEIRKIHWKYGEGFNIGDWLEFDNGTYSIEGDTIYKNDKPIAIVLAVKGGILGDDDEMDIKSINGTEKGTYHSK